MSDNNTNKSQLQELGVLWKKKSKKTGESFLSGRVNLKDLKGFPNQDVDLIIFTNKNTENPKAPNLKIYLSSPYQKPASSTATKQPVKVAQPVAAPVVEADDELI